MTRRGLLAALLVVAVPSAAAGAHVLTRATTAQLAQTSGLLLAGHHRAQGRRPAKGCL